MASWWLTHSYATQAHSLLCETARTSMERAISRPRRPPAFRVAAIFFSVLLSQKSSRCNADLFC
jgi:hypothetical protein